MRSDAVVLYISPNSHCMLSKNLWCSLQHHIAKTKCQVTLEGRAIGERMVVHVVQARNVLQGKCNERAIIGMELNFLPYNRSDDALQSETMSAVIACVLLMVQLFQVV